MISDALNVVHSGIFKEQDNGQPFRDLDSRLISKLTVAWPYGLLDFPTDSLFEDLNSLSRMTIDSLVGYLSKKKLRFGELRCSFQCVKGEMSLQIQLMVGKLVELSYKFWREE